MNEDGHVLKSRRGLLAAGLAVAVVGALGVASTMNAGAEQVSGDQEASQAPVADQADATTDVSTPPVTLPWGDKPQRAHRGRAGASSNELRAQGLQAASDTNGRHIDFAPKGRINRSSFLKSENTDVKPPTPAASASSSAPTSPATTSPTTTATTAPATTAPAGAAPVTQSTTSANTSPVQPLAATDTPSTAVTSTPPVVTGGTDNNSKALLFYSTASEATTADGMYAALDIKKPTLADGDFHTLAELAVQSADTHQTVEVGWNVDRSVNGDDDPHLFVFHWVNNVPTCYNTCDFVPYKGGVAPGDTLPSDTLKKFGIQHTNGAWWVAYDTTWVGYFPDKDWSSQGVDFTQGGYFQAWGEVAAATAKTCTQMGSGADPTIKTQVDQAARIGSITYVNNPATPNLFMRSSSSLYGMGPVTAKTFRFGGDPCAPKPSS
jgi:hypothetical protein